MAREHSEAAPLMGSPTGRLRQRGEQRASFSLPQAVTGCGGQSPSSSVSSCAGEMRPVAAESPASELALMRAQCLRSHANTGPRGRLSLYPVTANRCTTVEDRCTGCRPVLATLGGLHHAYEWAAWPPLDFCPPTPSSWGTESQNQSGRTKSQNYSTAHRGS